MDCESRSLEESSALPQLKDSQMSATIGLLTILFAASGLEWRRLASRGMRRQPLLEHNSEPRAQWRSLPELTGVYIALLWLVFHLLSLVTNQSHPSSAPLSLDSVATAAAINLGLCLILSLTLASGRRSWPSFGMTTSHWRDQMRVGLRGFFAAILPMAISMAATLPFRSLERQHSLLKLLANSPDIMTITVVAVTAVLSAPMLEELLFRVILQGWLTTFITPYLAIPTVAVLFALVHGWRDGLALMPLALLLGYVFHRQHRYLSVVMIHAMFNATMLILQLLNPQVP